MAVVRVRIGAHLDPGATAVFAPLIAAAAKARQAIAAEGRKGAEEFVGGYRSAPKHARAGFDAVKKGAEEGLISFAFWRACMSASAASAMR